MIVIQNAGIERTSVSHAALIVGVVPVLVALMAAALGRGSTGPLAWLGFALALGGVGLVAGGGSGASAAGDGLVLASVTLSAAAVTAQPRLLAGRDPVAVTAVQLGAGALVALPQRSCSRACGGTAGRGLGAAGGRAARHRRHAAAVHALRVRPGADRPQLAGAFLNLEPLVGALAGAAAFGDAFGPVQLAGGLVPLAGVALSAIRRPGRSAGPRCGLPAASRRRRPDRTTARGPDGPRRPRGDDAPHARHRTSPRAGPLQHRRDRRPPCWSLDDNEVFVALTDSKTGDAFEVPVRAGESAHEVFHHPFAFAALPGRRRVNRESAPTDVAPAGRWRPEWLRDFAPAGRARAL